MSSVVTWNVQLGSVSPARPEPLWVAVPLDMWPIAARECLVRNPLNGSNARLTADEFALISACSGAHTLAAHHAAIVERFNVPGAQRPAVGQFLQRCCREGLLIAMDDLVARCSDAAAAAAPCAIIVRTADRPALLARLLASAQKLSARAWHVLDDSCDGANRALNREIVRAQRMDCTWHEARDADLAGSLARAFPGAVREIDWLLGGTSAGDGYGRPVNHALLRFAGRRIIALDDDALLEPRRGASSLRGFAADSANDELFAYATEGELLDACPALDVDPIVEHERWLGIALAAAWRLASRSGAGEIGIASEDALRFLPSARVVFTQNGSVGDPGSSLFPFHVLSLPKASRAHAIARAERQRAVFVHRHDWRGVPRLRLAPRRLLTFTTAAGIDNRTMLPPTVATGRNEDLLLGAMAQIVHPNAWFADLPFALRHRRATEKQWVGPDAMFGQEPVHVLLDLIEQRATSITASSAEDRMATLAAIARDIAHAEERALAQSIEAQAIDTATRVLFSIASQLDDAAVPQSWKDLLRPWLTSPALALEGAQLAHRIVPVAHVRRLADDYGRALAVWPSLWRHCAETFA